MAVEEGYTDGKLNQIHVATSTTDRGEADQENNRSEMKGKEASWAGWKEDNFKAKREQTYSEL